MLARVNAKFRAHGKNCQMCEEVDTIGYKGRSREGQSPPVTENEDWILGTTGADAAATVAH